MSENKSSETLHASQDYLARDPVAWVADTLKNAADPETKISVHCDPYRPQNKHIMFKENDNFWISAAFFTKKYSRDAAFVKIKWGDFILNTHQISARKEMAIYNIMLQYCPCK